MLSENISEFKQYLGWLLEHNKTNRAINLHIGMPSPRGRMFQNQGLFPDLTQARENAIWAIENFSENQLKVSLFHTPGCLYPNSPEYAAENYLEAKQHEVGTEDYDTLNFEGDTDYVTNCLGCKFYQKCPGLPQYYIKNSLDEAENWVKPFQ